MPFILQCNDLTQEKYIYGNPCQGWTGTEIGPGIYWPPAIGARGPVWAMTLLNLPWICLLYNSLKPERAPIYCIYHRNMHALNAPPRRKQFVDKLWTIMLMHININKEFSKRDITLSSGSAAWQLAITISHNWLHSVNRELQGCGCKHRMLTFILWTYTLHQHFRIKNVVSSQCVLV